MCAGCCKEFTGWCRAFTKTELCLCLLQAIFLAVFIAFLTFLILHLVFCSSSKQRLDGERSQANYSTATPENNNQVIENDTEQTAGSFTQTDRETEGNVTEHSTLDSGVKCTWTPSQKTIALTQYYETPFSPTMTTQTDKKASAQGVKEIDQIVFEANIQPEVEDNQLSQESTDGDVVLDSRQDVLLALVKIKPPQDIIYGCTLTIVSEYWTLTAASCIEAIEEVDALDSFVMMRGFKEVNQNIHPVADVLIHPQYQGVNFTYDLAALKSETSLVAVGRLLVTLPSLVDYFLMTIGETLTILGYGRFRNIDKDPLTRSVRAMSVHRLPLQQCPAGAAAWAPRHLAGGTPLARGACGTSPLCAGVLRSRTTPCNYCSGTPLLKRAVLVGIMSDYQHCGLACEPALFVNLALVKEWLLSVLSN